MDDTFKEPQMPNFLPLEQMLRRTEASKDESDSSFFYDLITLGEMVTKLTALFLVSSIEDDVERTRYRFEHKLVVTWGQARCEVRRL